MENKEFYKRLKSRCDENDGKYSQCDLRLFCYTAPMNITEPMINEVESYISEDMEQ